MTRTVERFGVGGKAHRMLLALERSPQPIEALYDIADATTQNRREKVRFILRKLERMSAILSGGYFTITDNGRDLLDRFNQIAVRTKETA